MISKSDKLVRAMIILKPNCNQNSNSNNWEDRKAITIFLWGNGKPSRSIDKNSNGIVIVIGFKIILVI